MPALLLAAVMLAAPGFVAPSSPVFAQQQDRWRGVNGNNVTRVFHSGGGSFEHDEGGRWLEYGSDGSVIFSFEEERRDYNSVWLFDRSRRVRVEINLRTGDINGTPPFARTRLLYRITDADADRRGRGWRGRRGGGDGRGPGRRDDDWGGRDRDDGWGRDGLRDVEVGPIWNQSDAEQKCRAKAAELRVEWTGQWHTTVVGRMSVCQMRRSGGGYGGGYGNGGGRGVTREIEAGPIWNQRDAETKCRSKAQELRGEWTGQWRTTVQGRMSVCEIRMR